jgi:YfiH family protein
MIEIRLGPARAIWTDRTGGVSKAPFDDANLSTRVGDDPDAVHANRRMLAEAAGLPDPSVWWWLDQVHGFTTVVADDGRPGAACEADATVTAHSGVPMVVLTADCAPIALANETAAGVVHAGWQGIVAGVIDEAVARLRSVGDGDVRAALGPCIHPQHYEFGRGDLDRLVELLSPEVEARTVDGRPALDLPRAVHVALERAGVREVTDVDRCTAGSRSYFSHRRDGVTGRQGLVVVLDP